MIFLMLKKITFSWSSLTLSFIMKEYNQSRYLVCSCFFIGISKSGKHAFVLLSPVASLNAVPSYKSQHVFLVPVLII